MKRILALILILTMAVSLFACSKPAEGGEADSMVTVYLPISRTMYKADGSRGIEQNLYTYTDKGLLLTHVADRGLVQEIYNEDEYTYNYVIQPFDGTIDGKVEVTYNDQGHMLRYSNIYNEYNNETGELISSTDRASYAKGRNGAYHYTADGKIDYVEVYAVGADGSTEELVCNYRHYYDDKGNLVEIGMESVYDEVLWYQWAWAFRYDDQGRLITYAICRNEGVYICHYEYNAAGRITRMTWMLNQPKAPLDDQHVRQSTYQFPYSEHTYYGETVFTYDADGRLTSRKGYDENKQLVWEDTCQYRNGKVYKLTKGDETIIITTDESEAGTADKTLIEDANGNVIKVIDKDGSYVTIEYQSFRLSAEDAKIAQNSYFSYSQRMANGRRAFFSMIALLDEGTSAVQTVTHPVTELYPYDVELKE